MELDDYVIDELIKIMEHSKGMNLPKLMLEYQDLMKYRLRWDIDKDLTREDIFEMKKKVIKYMNERYPDRRLKYERKMKREVKK